MTEALLIAIKLVVISTFLVVSTLTFKHQVFKKLPLCSSYFIPTDEPNCLIAPTDHQAKGNSKNTAAPALCAYQKLAREQFQTDISIPHPHYESRFLLCNYPIMDGHQ
jgi:hypothetical protein